MGVAALALGWPWLGSGAVVSVALVWIAVTDGSPRAASAVVGTLAVAAIHVLLQVGLPARARPVPLLLVGAAATVVCARVAGLGDGILRPIAIAGRGGAPRLAGAGSAAAASGGWLTVVPPRTT